ncbi:MAG: hypothetical protein PHG54_04065 [Smithellaceae bacterium]|nr:hypothetical protein [Syntrophaceae bacterium]MDD4240582.1 hypothetical protein [Smithellaceae bacterium]NLX53322.1 hypothetical protein [Deltaproteobacteria bacterium]
MKQFVLTPAAGKRLIAKAVARHPQVQSALEKKTVVVVAGTTNGYVAEELLACVGQGGEFRKDRFFRGIILPPHRPQREDGRFPDESGFPGDVVIREGVWLQGKTIFDVAADLRAEDVVIKGANALDLANRRAAILIGHPQAGTVGAILPAHYGRRVRVILPVGLEKRVSGSLDDLAARINAPGVPGPRLLPVPGEVITELDAIALLTGAKAQLAAAGGVGGAEGSVWLLIDGDPAEEKEALALLQSIACEPAFTV